MVKSKKQEIFRKLNSTSGVSDSDVGKYVTFQGISLDYHIYIYIYMYRPRSGALPGGTPTCGVN